MDLTLDRKWKKDTYTIGKLYIDGTPFCETLEDRDRGLSSSMTLNEILLPFLFLQSAVQHMSIGCNSTCCKQKLHHSPLNFSTMRKKGLRFHVKSIPFILQKESFFHTKGFLFQRKAFSTTNSIHHYEQYQQNHYLAKGSHKTDRRHSGNRIHRQYKQPVRMPDVHRRIL